MVMMFRFPVPQPTWQVLTQPLFLAILNTILLGGTYWANGQRFLLATFTSALLFSGVHLLNRRAGRVLNARFPDIRQTFVRLPLLLCFSLLTSSLAVLAIHQFFRQAGWKPGQLPWAYLFIVFSVSLIIAVYEGILAFKRWERALRETEALKKANLQRQFEGLKSQINPHFLFNSLNTLSSLIEEDPDQAEEFVEELASVYRYLLRSNDMQTATLGAELDFIQSYFHLLRTRYGAHIHLEQRVDERYCSYILPPLTLQLLLENAVKHNVILPELPLFIRIWTTGQGQLVVQNNLQRKTTRVSSNRVGLANIAAQYRLLGPEQIRVEDNDQDFTVTLPLFPKG